MQTALKSFRVCALLQALLILALVPTGRTIQNMLEVCRIRGGLICGSFVVLAAGTALAAGALYILKLREVSDRRAVLRTIAQAAVIAGISVLCVQEIVEWMHFPLYSLLTAFLWLGCAEMKRPAAMLTAMALSSTVSLADEGVQALHPERFFDVRDLVINFAAALLGLYFSRRFVRKM